VQVGSTMSKSPGEAASIALWMLSKAKMCFGGLPPIVTVTVSIDCLAFDRRAGAGCVGGCDDSSPHLAAVVPAACIALVAARRNSALRRDVASNGRVAPPYIRQGARDAIAADESNSTSGLPSHSGGDGLSDCKEPLGEARRYCCSRRMIASLAP